jgi:hypothetical protein
MADRLTVYIVGSGHSGSTLLDLILGAHSAAFSLGEIDRFDQYRLSNGRCTCGEPMGTCPFWSCVLSGLKGADLATSLRYPRGASRLRQLKYVLSVGLSYWLPPHVLCPILGTLAPPAYRQALNAHALFDQVRRISEKPLVVDSSKACHRMKFLWLTRPASTRVIFLTRDVRGFAHSYMRKHGLSASEAAKLWMRGNRRVMRMLRTIPRSCYAHVRYEQISREPEATSARLCHFLGLEFEPDMLRLGSQTNHMIGGNRMRLAHRIQIAEDLGWREALSSADLDAVDHIAGRLNRRLLGDDWAI